MKILLVGEFSGVHTELANALKEMSYDVTTISDGDAYKNFPRDITIKSKIQKNKISILINYILEYLGVKGLCTYVRSIKTLKKLKGYDIVQLINPIPLNAFGSFASFLFVRYLSKNNGKLILCALGDDYRWVTACLEGQYKYSAMDNLKIRNLHLYLYSLKYKYGLFYKQQHLYTENKCSAIIPGLLDYKIAYKGNSKLSEIIKIPVRTKYQNGTEVIDTTVDRKIIIFHGWQVGKELKKGNYIFDSAIEKIILKYGEDRIEYVVCKSIPYDEYIKLLHKADIFLDQIYSYDCGVNAILGMACGSVVFSGYENVQEDIGVNASNCETILVDQLSNLIENPNDIFEIKNNAIKYVKNKHDPYEIARQYLNIWRS